MPHAISRREILASLGASGWLLPKAASGFTTLAPVAPVATARCKTYKPSELAPALDGMFDRLGPRAPGPRQDRRHQTELQRRADCPAGTPAAGRHSLAPPEPAGGHPAPDGAGRRASCPPGRGGGGAKDRSFRRTHAGCQRTTWRGSSTSRRFFRTAPPRRNGRGSWCRSSVSPSGSPTTWPPCGSPENTRRRACGVWAPRILRRWKWLPKTAAPVCFCRPFRCTPASNSSASMVN